MVSMGNLLQPAVGRAITEGLEHLGYSKNKKTKNEGASLVAQWLRICLLMQGTQVRALVWEDPTYRGATGPVNHNC